MNLKPILTPVLKPVLSDILSGSTGSSSDPIAWVPNLAPPKP